MVAGGGIPGLGAFRKRVGWEGRRKVSEGEEIVHRSNKTESLQVVEFPLSRVSPNSAVTLVRGR